MNPRIFREYDIRGVADRDLSDDVARAIGLAIGRRVENQLVVVGRDCRLHSPRVVTSSYNAYLRRLQAMLWWSTRRGRI